ncbi:hypothetical protein Tsubulata_034889 [Turnera subulata]|uniref:COP1-interacting protein 7 n=1 Tax=Turnera subulata TaxID=218843 RepID=A0A9Q0F3K1_9ROSI|nr:hypothetical protein Tsubulata_034889 [Turnera subulata]
MKSSTRLDSAVFQLTPTRTRCDLIISANGKTEKIASGLVNPFLAHLKSAQDQMDKGGYSIILEPDPGSDATWFTKGTVERFVRFVSTPEVLERVYTLESEILQIEEAIAIQSNNDIGLSTVNDHQQKPTVRIEGSRPPTDSNEEKAIVLYSPGARPPESNGSTVQEGNSKVQLMKVLDTRRTVLQKEQGMAFARAVAAGYDIDHMPPLLSFSESFGASRLMDACLKFMELWKRKHETGQWVEIEAAEAMSSRSDFASMNTSGIVFSNGASKQFPEALDSNGKAGVSPSSDQKPPVDQQPPPGHQEYFQGQFPHLMFPPWPMHSPPGAPPVFQGYPMQGIPYYQNYPGNGPVFPPSYSSGEDPRLHAGQRRRSRRHSMDSNVEPETWEVDTPKTRSQDDLELEQETSGNREPGRKGSRSAKRQSGKVVIRNINYITSKRQDSSGSESESASASDIDEEDGEHGKSLRSSKRKGSLSKSVDKGNSSDREGTVYGKEDTGHWQAFQTYLLKDADEAERAVNQGTFEMEKEARVQRRKNTVGHDLLLLNRQDIGDDHDWTMMDMQGVNGNLRRMTRTSTDESLISGRMGQSGDGRRFIDGQLDVDSAEMAGRRGGYRRTANDDFLVQRHENKSGYSQSDPMAINGFERRNNDLDRRSSQNMDDDSYIVSLRSTPLDQDRTRGRNTIDMDSEFPASGQSADNQSNRDRSIIKYEPDALSLMPEREMEMGTIGYDPALDYDMHISAENGASANKKNKDIASKKLDKDRKSKLTPDSSDKKKTGGPIRKGKPSKMSPLDEAKARAEKLRTFKADLQKMKKEKEEEEMKRLEALKLARQKRIAARGSSVPTQSASQQTRKQLPTKLSPIAHKGSKFTDADPGPSSPLQRFPIRTLSAGSSDSLKASKASKMSMGSHSAGNRLSHSVSSLPETKKENGGVTPGVKASAARIRRLSEPKISSSNPVSSVKPRNSEPISKPKVSNVPETKKLSAIVNHDKSKAASLPELKIKTPKGTDVVHGKSAAKEIPQKMSGGKSAPTTSEGAKPKRNDGKISHHSDVDDNPIIEKTVVILECEKPQVSSIHAPEQANGVPEQNSAGYKARDKEGTRSEYAAIRAPVSPLDGMDRERSQHQLPKQQKTYEDKTENASNPENEASNLSDVAEKTYQAPFARVSSIEDPSTRNSEYAKAPMIGLPTVIAGTEAHKTHISDSKTLKLEKIPEALDKSQTKESSKGFRRLLKFGKKSHTAGDRYGESDNATAYGSEADDSAANVASSSEAHTLKNLISQDETPSAGSTPQKTSRHFSLLSSFRSKTSEKKLTVG